MPAEAAAARVLVAQGVTKRFGTVVANSDIDFDVREGEIHALLGENGSGKTTLLDILYGLVRADAGSVRMQPPAGRARRDERGWVREVSMVPQHLQIVPTLTVAQNVALMTMKERMPYQRVLRLVGNRLAQLSERYGLHLHPDALAGTLSVSERQRLALLRALYVEPRVLLLDEPTSRLTQGEADRLYGTLRNLVRRDRTAVVLTTHRAGEVLEFADRVTVLRSGRRIVSLELAELTLDRLVDAMVGRRQVIKVVSRSAAADESETTLLAVDGLSVDRGPEQSHGLPALHDVCFRVHAGEVLGIAGVEGNGQSTLELALVGLVALSAGQVAIKDRRSGRSLRVVSRPGRRPRRILELAYVPSDRTRFGLAESLTVGENLMIHQLARGGGLRRSPITARSRAALRALLEKYQVRPADPDLRVAQLSGGNAQKVLLARELERDTTVTIAAQPTAGLDMASAAMVRRTLQEQARTNRAVVLISSDLDELIELCSRVAVMHRGRLVEFRDRGDFDRGAIGVAMTGAVPS